MRERIAAIAAAQARLSADGRPRESSKLKSAGRYAEAFAAVGLDTAFDVAEAAAALIDEGASRFRDDLKSLDAERLLWSYPREDDGRWPVNAMVLLEQYPARVEPGARRHRWVAALSPVARSTPQRIALSMVDVIGDEQSHVWNRARWLWDERARDASGLQRWGVGELPTETLALLERGDWQAALRRHRVTHSMQGLTDHTTEAGEQLVRAAPWRLAIASGRLFNLPGQKSVRKAGVEVHEARLYVEVSGSLRRLPQTDWKLPLEVELLHCGHPPWPVEREDAPRPVAVPARGRSRPELFAAVLADPADDAPRRVFADWLLEQGDSRGEFIHLQLSGKAPKRERRLLRLERANWFGPLVQAKGLALERGFISACRLGTKTTARSHWKSALECLDLMTVRELVLDDAFPPDEARQLVGSGLLRSLRVLTLATPEAVPWVPKLDALTLRVTTARSISGASRLPEVSSLTLALAYPRRAGEAVVHQWHADWIRDVAARAKVSHLRIDVSDDPWRMHDWQAVARELPSGAPPLTIDLGRDSDITFSRDGVHVRLRDARYEYLLAGLSESLADWQHLPRRLTLREGVVRVQPWHALDGFEIWNG